MIFKPDMSSLTDLDSRSLVGDDGIKMNRVQKVVLFFLVMLMVMMLLPGFFPNSTFFVIAFLKKIGSTGICILLVMLMCLIDHRHCESCGLPAG